MPLIRAGLVIWNPSIFKGARTPRSEIKNVSLVHGQDLSTLEKPREWRHSRLGMYGASLSTRGPCDTKENEMISRRRVSCDQHQRHHSHKFCHVGEFTRQERGHRNFQFEDHCGVGPRPNQLKLRRFSRMYCSRQDSEIKKFQAVELQCGAEFAAAHPVGKLNGNGNKAVTSSIEVPIFRFSTSRKKSNSKFHLSAVTDGDTLRDGGKDNRGLDGNKDQSDRIKITQEKNVRSGGQLLGSYATTTAIAIQDSLPPEGFVVLMSCAVGLMTGVCVVLFNLGVHEIHDIVWDGIPNIGAAWLRTQPLENTWFQIVLIPAGGGVVVGILNSLRKALQGPSEENSFRSYAKVFVRQLLKTGAAAVTLGTGNSLGPEGPSVEIGAAIANGVTTVLRNSRERKLSLVAAGSAAGISSGFNAAVAGCFFAVESVLPGLSSADSAPSLTTAMVLLSSVLASVVSQAGLGSDPAFRIPPYEFRSPTELPLYLLLGVLCGGVSVALVKGIACATTMFEMLQKATSLPAGFLPPLGGLCVSLIALVYPEVLYWGFENVDVLLESHLPWIQGPSASLLLQLVGAKLVATSLCRGSGLVGGVYAPSLFIGAALGSAYGSLASYASTYADPMWHLDVLQVAAPQAYALVGMAATLAGVCQVPLTSVLLLFELTRDYRIILPLMAAVGLSSWVASTFQRKRVPAIQVEVQVNPGDVLSMTSFRGGPGPQTAALITNSKLPVSTATPLKSRRISRDKELCNLEDSLCLTGLEFSEDHLTGEILVLSAMRTRYIALTGDTSLREAMARMVAEKEWCFLVVNQDKHLEGLLTLSDIQQEAGKARSSGLVQELAMKPISSLYRSVSASGEIQVITVFPDMTLKAAQRLMAGRGLRQVPVIAHNVCTQGKETGKVVLGLLDREGIKLACRAEATKRILLLYGPLNGQTVPDGTNLSQ